MIASNPKRVAFDLEYMPLDALVNLANAASAEINAYIDADLENPDAEAMEIRFESIIKALEELVASGEDIGGRQIDPNWDITAHVVIPKF